MLERQKTGHQEARGVPLPVPEATYEEITKTGVVVVVVVVVLVVVVVVVVVVLE